MKNNLEIEFSAFFNYFRAQVEIIEFLGKELKTYQSAYLLLCACIDSLAGFRYGFKTRNRFINFLLNYSGEEHRKFWSKISKYYLDQPLLVVNKKGEYQTKISRGRIRRLRKRLYGKGGNNFKDLLLDQALEKIRKLKLYKIKNGKRLYLYEEEKRKLLLQFSYVDYFYHWYRCFGLHAYQCQCRFESVPPGRLKVYR